MSVVFSLNRPMTGGIAFTPRQTDVVVNPLVVQWEMNITNAANYVLGAGANVATINNLSGSGIGNATSATNQAEINTAAINGVDALLFNQSTGQDAYIIQTSTAMLRNKSEFWMDDCALFPTAALAANNLYFTYYTSGAGGIVAVTVLTTGAIRVSTRRIAGDGALSVTSSNAKVYADQQHFLAVYVNYETATCTIRVDDQTETFTFVRSGGYLGWASGLGPIEDAAASANAVIGRDGASLFRGEITRARIGYGTYQQSDYEARRAVLQPQFLTPKQKVNVAEVSAIAKNKIYRSVAGVATVAVSGSLKTGVADGTIKMRLLDITTLAADGTFGTQNIATSVGGAWSANVSVINGSWYGEYRIGSDTNYDAVIDRTTILGVGSVTMLDGQSLMTKQTTEGTTPYPVTTFPAAGDDLRDRRFTTSGHFFLSQTIAASQNVLVGTGESAPGGPYPTSPDVNGNGQVRFGKRRRTRTSKPELVFQNAIGGTAYSEHLGSGYCWLFVLANAAVVGGPGYGWDRVCVSLGQKDILNGASYADTYSNIGQYVTQVRAVATLGNSLPIYIAPPSWLTFGSPTAANHLAGTQAHWNYIDDHDNGNTDGTGLVRIGWTDHDIVRTDGAHLPSGQTGNELIMCRLEQNIAYYEGLATYGARGPKLASITATAGTNLVVGTFTHDGPVGTKLVGLTSNSGITGTKLKVNGTLVTPTTVNINTGTDKLEWTKSGNFVSGDVIGVALYIDGDFDQSNVLMDDNSGYSNDLDVANRRGVPAQVTRSAAADGYIYFTVP